MCEWRVSVLLAVNLCSVLIAWYAQRNSDALTQQSQSYVEFLEDVVQRSGDALGEDV